jgi:HSP20 family protein
MSLIPWRNKLKEGVPSEDSPLAALRGEMDRLFEAYVRDPLASIEWPFAAQGGWCPAIDVYEDDQQIAVRAEIPGMDPNDVEVTVTGNQLVLSGEKKESSEQSGKEYRLTESRYGAFRRTIPLSGSVDAAKVEAQCANGVLTIRLPKTQAAAARRINVKVT